MSDRVHRDDRLVALGLFAVSFLALLWLERPVGFVRDESVYFEAGEQYARWVQAFFASPRAALEDRAIAASFQFNSEHPVLMKLAFGLSHQLFHQKLDWVRSATAFRIPACLVSALIPALLYLFGVALKQRRAGLFAALSFFLVPRHLFNGVLSCFDMPVAAFWLLTVYLYLRAQTERWAIVVCGIAFGLTLATKHNALFLPFVLGAVGIWLALRQSEPGSAARRWVAAQLAVLGGAAMLFAVMVLALGTDGLQQRFLLLSPQSAVLAALVGVSVWILHRLSAVSVPAFHALAPLAAMGVLGPVIFYLHWPYLWHHPVDRTAAYLAFHATHNHYTWFYLGELLRQPPFPLAYVLVKTAFTVPLSLFVPMCLGFVYALVRAVRALTSKTSPSFTLADGLVLLNAVVAIAIISHPQVPHFGGVKHWLPSMPFLALLAGESVTRAADALKRFVPRAGEALFAALCVLLFAPALWATARVHPYGTSYYSETAGGLPGAASLGMQRQFWSNNVTGVLGWVNANARPRERIYLHEVNGYSFRDYQRNGMLRADLQPAGGPHDATIAAYQVHQEFKEHEMNIWQVFGTRRPVTGLYLDETPQVVVYRR